jgi:hypothetical protein
LVRRFASLPGFPSRRGTAAAGRRHAALHLDGTANSIDYASELDENAISRPLNDAAVMQSDCRIDQIAAKGAQPRKRAILIGASKSAISDHVGR